MSCRSSDASLRAFERSLLGGWGGAELQAMRARAPAGAARVFALRHSMGRHNYCRGAVSVLFRDSMLSRFGRSQSELMAEALQLHGLADSFDLVVVSPFARALETAAGILGPLGASIPTVVQPLCAEHSLFRSAMQRGDRGSSATTLRKLFPTERFPHFDFSPLDRYCEERGVLGGRWWRHSRGTWFESREQFADRCEVFRRWLGAECARRGAARVLLVGHGAALKTTFGLVGRKYGNCEGRAVDVRPDGAFDFVNPFMDFDFALPALLPEEAVDSGEGSNVAELLETGRFVQKPAEFYTTSTVGSTRDDAEEEEGIWSSDHFEA